MNLSSSEYYHLVCCNTNVKLKINDESVVFKYNGVAVNGNTPDLLFNKVVGQIITASNSKIEGCYFLIPAEHNCDLVLFKVILWEKFFYDLKVYDECCECLPKEKPKEKIYFKKLFVSRKNENKTVELNFADLMKAKALKQFEGIQICCLPDEVKTVSRYKVSLLKSLKDDNICCPKKQKVLLKFDAGSAGVYKYFSDDCLVITETIDVEVYTEVTICVLNTKLDEIVFVSDNSSSMTVELLNINC